MKKKITILLSLFLFCLSLTGCNKFKESWDTVETGTLYYKQYILPKTTIYYTIASTGKACWRVPHVVHIPEKYYVVIKISNEKYEFDDKDVYNNYHLGDSIEMDAHYTKYAISSKIFKEVSIRKDNNEN